MISKNLQLLKLKKKNANQNIKDQAKKFKKIQTKKRINNVGRNYRDHQQQWIRVEKKQKRNHSCQMSQNFKRISNCLQQMYQVSTNEHEYKNTYSM